MFSFFEEINFPLSKSAPKDKCVKMFKKHFQPEIAQTLQTHHKLFCSKIEINFKTLKKVIWLYLCTSKSGL